VIKQYQNFPCELPQHGFGQIANQVTLSSALRAFSRLEPYVAGQGNVLAFLDVVPKPWVSAQVCCGRRLL
jgi:hypothetical protein